MEIVLMVIEVYGEKTYKIKNYIANDGYYHLYPRGTQRKVLKLYFSPLKIKMVMQTAIIDGRIDIIDAWYVNKWKDLK
jgi:hypothetical protein